MFPVADYKIEKFQRSPDSSKKYRVTLRNKIDNSIAVIDFGARAYQQYRDTTPLKLYSNLDHNDESRLKLYRQRFERLYDPRQYCGHI